MSDRIRRLRELLDEPLLVTAPVNVLYLTGFQSSNAALLVEAERVLLFTDFRYATAARSVAGVELVEAARSLVPDLARRLSGRIAFEADALTYAGYEALRTGGLELVPRSGLVERLRAVKDEDELAAIARAAAIGDRAYERLADERFIGRSERELAWRMEQLLREEGAEDAAFDIIVAAGPNAALPHAHPGERVVEPGQTVIVDAGAAVGGYRSDCTRTFAAGPLDERAREAYRVCLEAQRAGRAAMRPGTSGRDADAAARDVVDASDFRGTFGHGLGHGVGLLIHEAPVARPESTDVLEAGNVITVEPGIYLEGAAGIRIEDLVVVSEDGHEILTGFTKDLVTVG